MHFLYDSKYDVCRSIYIQGIYMCAHDVCSVRLYTHLSMRLYGETGASCNKID